MTEKIVWVKYAILGWALFLGGLGAWGWALGGEAANWPAAIVSIFACVLMLNASHQLRLAQGRRFPMAIWGSALLLFGSWSGYSAHHAAELAMGDVGGAESFFLLVFFTLSTVIDPFLGWAVADNLRAEIDGQRAPVDAPPPRLVVSDGAIVGGVVRSVGGATTVVGGVVASVATPATGVVTRSPLPSPPADGPAEIVSTQTFRDARDHARALRAMDRHMSTAEIARRVNRPRTTVSGWLQESDVATGARRVTA